jgi:hypothetical protein
MRRKNLNPDFSYDEDLSCTDTGIHHFLKNICGTQWILDIGYNTDTGT